MKPGRRTVWPSFEAEDRLHEQGVTLIAGIDEAGRGALAGPVVAAAVILPRERSQQWLGEVRDSKLLSQAAREYYYEFIKEEAACVGVGVCDSADIDRIGILPATKQAMRKAVEALEPRPEYLLIDYLTLNDVPISQKGITYGDSLCVSIACASIVAKVTRDRIMAEHEKHCPGYGLARNKGYGTAGHLERLACLGPSAIHRRSFRPVRECLRTGP